MEWVRVGTAGPRRRERRRSDGEEILSFSSRGMNNVGADLERAHLPCRFLFVAILSDEKTITDLIVVIFLRSSHGSVVG